ncbi:MAG: glycoside hydrolase family 3 C-terminal domain-containing protein, partial [Clostridia bacterium]
KEDDIAFIGEFAEKPRFQGGGSSHINCFKTTGAVEAAKGLKVTYARGYDVAADDAPADMIAEAAAAAKKAKVAVVFAGLPDAYESEGYDRTHMRMPESQNRLIEAVAEANPNTVVVLHNGSPVEMPWIGRVKGVLEAYLGGQAVGLAEVKVLFGDVNPSGHLPESFPIKLEDNPSYLFYGGEPAGTEYREGIFVGYRYYDKKKMDVLFPFGYGLSYTTFEYSGLKLSKDKILDTDTVTVTVTVKNTGKRAGKTVAQVYVGDVEGYVNAVRPVRELKAFRKVELQPGESKEVSFTLCKRAFATWRSEIHDWFVESGEFSIEVGDSSACLPLKATVTVESTQKLPAHYDMNSIVMDLMKDPKAKEVIMPLVHGASAIFGDGEGGSEAANEAVTEEMSMAMMQYMPLRSMLGFSNGAVTGEMIDEMLKKMNE